MWTKEQIETLKRDLTGKKIAKIDFVPAEGEFPDHEYTDLEPLNAGLMKMKPEPALFSYWVFTFEDDSEISFKFMVELV